MPYSNIPPDVLRKISKGNRFSLKGAVAHLLGADYKKPETEEERKLEDMQEKYTGGLLSNCSDINFYGDSDLVSARVRLLQMLCEGNIKATGLKLDYVGRRRREEIPAQFWQEKNLHLNWDQDIAGLKTGADSVLGIFGRYEEVDLMLGDPDYNYKVDIYTLDEFAEIYTGVRVAHFDSPWAIKEPPVGESQGPSRRGPRPTKLEAVKQAMRNDLCKGLLTADELGEAKQLWLAAEYGAARGTCVRARKEVLSELDTLSKIKNRNSDKQ